MKKIMFNDKYGLTQAVLEGRKDMTRRFAEKVLVEDENGFYCWNGGFYKPHYKPGEVVAVAQAYRNIPHFNPDTYEDVMLDFGTICEASHPYSHLMQSSGWENKMFVRADLMPNHIRITDVREGRLQDITDEDCLREGIKEESNFPHKKSYPFYFDGGKKGWDNHFSTPRKAFAALIDKVSGRGTWAANPYVFVYEFELVK